MNIEYTIEELAPYPYDLEEHCQRVGDQVWKGDNVLCGYQELSHFALIQEMGDIDGDKANKYLTLTGQGKKLPEELILFLEEVLTQMVDNACRDYCNENNLNRGGML